ncbi:hypothetical protein COLO4_32570 [Corchorus olitorius]|uniref:Uncharacterized protein n=1 Tax=Corchorus olitorius TaxID=93759 RepID=A0A1R3GZ94_9ROSI|nr:hypothetical protein COLO4_32570 [Corchorus olitorius]
MTNFSQQLKNDVIIQWSIKLLPFNFPIIIHEQSQNTAEELPKAQKARPQP